MEPRLETQNDTVSLLLDLEKVTKAFQAANIFSKLYEPPTEADFEYISRKGLTVLQWRLLNLYKKMLDDELIIYKEECANKGKPRVHTSGLCFREKMIKFSAISEKVFQTWAERLDIQFFYRKLLIANLSDSICFEQWAQNSEKRAEFYDELQNVEEDSEPIHFVNYSGNDIYKRFNSLLRILA